MLDLERQVYVIFGLGGMIGNTFYKKLVDITSDYRIYAFDHARVNICNKSHIAPLLEYIQPTVVINCASVSDPDICENAISGAHEVNAMGPASLAEEAAKSGAKFVSMSHYMVFGDKKTPHTEKSPAKPINILGKTKEDGERRVRELTDNHLIIRPGWLFGDDGDCLVKEWISQAERNMRVNVMEGQEVSPVFADDLVDGVLNLLAKDAKGTYNVANSGTSTVSDIANATINLCKLKNTVTIKNPYMAPMPKKTLLSCAKYNNLTGKDMRPWLDALKECLYRIGRFQP